jgi:hypothetical protein
MTDRKDTSEGQGRPVNLAILVPSGDQWDADFCLSLLQLERYLLYRPIHAEFDFCIINERGSLIAMQRENMVKTALKNEEITHILFLDSDMTFPPNLFHVLLAHDLPIVGCNYVKRTIPAMPNSRDLDGKLISTTKESTGLVEADSAGFGAVLLKREVFDGTPQPWFDTVWLDKTDEGKGYEMMGEDVFFFRKARRIGGFPLFIDQGLSQRIGHVGSYTYENWMCETMWEVYGQDDLKQEMMA